MACRLICAAFITAAIAVHTEHEVIEQSLTAVEGDTVEVSCPSGGLPVRTAWGREDDNMCASMHYVTESKNVVRFEEITRDCAGHYLCKTFLKDGNGYGSVTLTVVAPARILERLSSGNMSVQEGETIQLTCNVTGTPAPHVTWSRYDVSTRHERRSPLCVGTEQSGRFGEHLLVPNITRQCSGLYQCVAYNGIAVESNRRMIVDVMFPPKVTLPNTRIGQMQGRETMLECVISANPQALSMWKHHGQTIQNGGKYRVERYDEGNNTITLSLRVRNIQAEDYGTYTCLASNMLGQDIEEMQLYEYPEAERSSREIQKRRRGGSRISRYGTSSSRSRTRYRRIRYRRTRYRRSRYRRSRISQCRLAIPEPGCPGYHL